MSKAVILAIVSLFLLSAFLVSINVAAEGVEEGDFPNRTFYVTRSPPGGPRSDVYYSNNTTPAESGLWSARLDTLAGSAIIVQVYQIDGGSPVLLAASKLRTVGQETPPIVLYQDDVYQMSFTPYGKSGTSILRDVWKANLPPDACFTYSPASPYEGQPISFDASCSADPDGTIASYSWDFGDGNTASGAMTTHTYGMDGTYDVTLRVADNLGGFDVLTVPITVLMPVNEPPVAAFSWSPLEPKEQDPVMFDGRASRDPDGMIVSYSWDFGDGNTATGSTATNTYAMAGLYTVTLTVTDDDGATDDATAEIRVLPNDPPVAQFSWSPLTPKALYDDVRFDGSVSYDSDGFLVAWDWDFGDGHTGTGSVAINRYSLSGDYPVTLRVTDNKGATGRSTETIRIVDNLPPTASFTWTPSMPKEGRRVDFDASASNDPDGTIVDYHWVWGDSLSESSGTSPLAFHTYAADGTYTVVLHVTDDNGAMGMAQADIVVAPIIPPIARIIAPAEGVAGVPALFDGSGSSDADGMIVLYEWDFQNDGLVDATGPTATWTYPAAGTYTVALKVTDDDGASGRAEATIQVRGNEAPVAVIAYSPMDPMSRDLVTFDGRGSYDPGPTGDSIVSYSWSFADDGSTASGAVVTHTFARPGTWRVTLTVRDTFGAPGSALVDVSVDNDAPVAVLSVSPLSALTYEVITADGSASSDSDGMIVSYLIDWGDDATSAGPIATHLYADGPRTYTITLRVRDDSGAESTDSKVVSIVNRAPTASFVYTQISTSYKDPVQFDASGSSDRDGLIALYEWDFQNDGTFDAMGPMASYQYSRPGTYTVLLRVTDDDGASASTTRDVTVENLRPVAVLSVSPLSALTYEDITADGSSSSDPEGSALTYSIAWGDDATSAGPRATHRYTDGTRTYTVTLTVEDAFGARHTDSKMVEIRNRAPTATLSVSPASALTGELFTATGTASDMDGMIASSSIAWGDEAVTSGLTGTHAYTAPGAYTVTLTVTDDDGASASATFDVTVLNRAPTASFVYTQISTSYKDPIHFDASGSSDPDGMIVSYSWNFGDDTTGSGAHIFDKRYAAPGTYTVTLTVTDDDGASASTSKDVTVGNFAPTAVLSVSPLSALTYEDITADGSSSSDPEGSALTYSIAWGDDATSAGPRATHRYTDGTRTYLVTLVVTDAFGMTGIDTEMVEIRNRPPSATLSVSPSSAYTGDTFTATGTASDMDGMIASSSIAWGDEAVTSGLTGTHAYTAPGAYTVTLTVTDDDGASASATFDVTVLKRNEPPTASFTWMQRSGTLTVDFDASASNDPDGTIVDYHWVWGDMMSESSGTSPLAFHNYAAAGTYRVTLHVTDDAGALGTFTADVNVVDTAPPTWRYYDFFGVPYGEWWDMRWGWAAGVGDRPVGANCFSAEGLAAGYCAPMDPNLPDVASYPYANWAPSVLAFGDESIYAPYRFEGAVKDSAAYTIGRPVILPKCTELAALLGSAGIILTCPAAEPGGTASVDLRVDYMTTARMTELSTTRGCPDIRALVSGVLTELRLTVTMDDIAARQLFGVTSPTMWSFGSADTSLLASGCGTGSSLPPDPESGKLEKGLTAWLDSQANGPYDIYAAFGDAFKLWGIEASGSYDSVTQRHTLTLSVATWGAEVLVARWFYWGATAYTAGVSSGAAPAGWWGMEAPWLESLSLVGTIGADFDATVTGVQQNHFKHLADAGPDTTFGTVDDVAKWVWQPVLADRYVSAVAPPPHVYSELDAYTGHSYVHSTPGTYAYGVSGIFDYAPVVWNLRAGDKHVFEFPTRPVVLVNPFASAFAGDPSFLTLISAPIKLGYSVPAGLGSYDAATNVLTVTGPTAFSAPLTGGSKPLESRPTYNLVQA